MKEQIHIPVLKEEVLSFLNPQKNQNFVDCTAGMGGHALALLERNGPEGKVLALEWDTDLYKLLKNKKRLLVFNESYTRLEEIVERENFHPISGILFDLGFSSFHTERSGRGFSFMKDEPLDMRYNKNTLLTAEKIVNQYKEKDLFYIFRKWGEEKYAREIARNIVSKRKKEPIKTTKDLARIIEKSVPSSYKSQRINCATKTFQSLRIAVNGEIMNMKEGLTQALRVLPKKGRIAVITFHGIEEKTLLDFIKENNLFLLTKKPITPRIEEIKNNIRSRSAKLRVIIK